MNNNEITIASCTIVNKLSMMSLLEKEFLCSDMMQSASEMFRFLTLLNKTHEGTTVVAEHLETIISTDALIYFMLACNAMHKNPALERMVFEMRNHPEISDMLDSMTLRLQNMQEIVERVKGYAEGDNILPFSKQ
jgi:hypothetical protein